MGWYDERFTEREGRLRMDCLACGRAMFFPPSKHGKYLTCGDDCARQHRRKPKLQRERSCETCGAVFTPRAYQLSLGHGRYCSQKCNLVSHVAMNTKEAKRKAVASWLRRHAESSIVKSGPANPRWKGGRDAAMKRAQASGKRLEWGKRYRQQNPEKVREFRLRRKGRKYGRLPQGTVSRIGESQRWKCAVCRVGIRDGYHLDHILPLALGGLHEPTNVQLLCATCNVRKWAKHPIDFMQERGFLL